MNKKEFINYYEDIVERAEKCAAKVEDFINNEENLTLRFNLLNHHENILKNRIEELYGND
jgi:hypothetical protein